MKIISFEGIEGVGKSTQINMLYDLLVKKNFKVLIFREPGSTDTGEKIRNILLNSDDSISVFSELFLMFASRAQLIEEKIKNADCDFILLDRYYDASLAYQGYGRGISINLINKIIKELKCPEPDSTFLLDIDPKKGFARKANDKKDRIESSGLRFFEKVRNGYIDIAKISNNRIKIINAENSINEIHITILNYLKLKP